MTRTIAVVLALAAAGTEERRLASVPEGVRLAHRPSFDEEGRSVVWSGLVDEQMWLYVGDERKAGPFDCVCSPSISARGGRVAFAGIREGKRYAFIDGAEGVPYDYVIIPVVVSAGDGRPGASFDEVRAPVLSADGKRCAYAAQRAGAWTVVVDDRPGAFYDFVDDPVFSADGRAVAFSTGFRIVCGDRVLGPFDAVTAPALSADGRVVAYGRKSGGRWSIVAGDRDLPVEGDLERVFISADGSRVGGVVQRDRKLGVVVGLLLAEAAIMASGS